MSFENQLVQDRKDYLEYNQGTIVEDVQRVDVEYQDYIVEQVVLVKVYNRYFKDLAIAEYELSELKSLCETAGAIPLAALIVQRSEIDKTYYIGKGKLEELKNICETKKADTVVFDNELAPSQRRAIEDELQIKVIDRVQLILDIFALHAKSNDGKLQVQLAQYEYLLPRLRGWGMALTRQGGGQTGAGQGMGSRGPGETKLELDRRKLNNSIAKIKVELKKIHQDRILKRKKRVNNQTLSVALVGYTNSGKSSCLKALSGYTTYIENALFATVDTTTKKVSTTHGLDIVATDTVGFISNLPHQLVESFKATLEESIDCDVLVHIVDASAIKLPNALDILELQITAVNEALNKIGPVPVPVPAPVPVAGADITQKELLVMNKIDLLEPEELASLQESYPDAIFISSINNTNIDTLRDRIESEIVTKYGLRKVIIPYSNYNDIQKYYSKGIVYEKLDTAEGVELTVIDN
jgi:GTP-binding protein HflX